jgi:hypothetical protein
MPTEGAKSAILAMRKMVELASKWDETEWLQEHIQADHEILKALWNLHQPDGIYCKFDGFTFPCWERRMLEGSMPLEQ